ncbi:hypothetical protein [Bradyrhizobium guangxiense]|uniref:hypothetical protein n=1 Tax=Bradyrhizobium guangxiense TaxID=1325115 RepID=UPI001008E756|nr:hypothetical protein [Bradyrhizobium guangxiense]
MNEAQQLALAMFVLACAAMTLVAGQLYMNQGSEMTSAPRRLQTMPLGISSPTQTSRSAIPDFAAQRRS